MVPEVNQQSPIRIAEMVGMWCHSVETENLFAPRHRTPELNHISGAGSIAVEIEHLDDLARIIFDLIQTDRVRVEPHLVNQHDAIVLVLLLCVCLRLVSKRRQSSNTVVSTPGTAEAVWFEVTGATGGTTPSGSLLAKSLKNAVSLLLSVTLT